MLNDTPRKRSILPWLLAVLLLAAGVRAVHLIRPHLDSDHAVVGLMAMHLLDGEPSAIYWGQDYGGSQESWVAALTIALDGPTRQALGAAPALISLAYLVFLYLLGKEIFGRREGLLAVFLAGLGPFYLTWISVVARGIYSTGLLLITMTLWAAARMLKREPGGASYAWHAVLFGFLAGQAVWAHPLAGAMVAAAGLVIWRRDLSLVFRPRFLGMVIAFFVGSLPWWYYNLTHNWQTIHYFLSPKAHSGLLNNLKLVAEKSFAVLVGAQTDVTNQWVLPYFSHVVLGLAAAAAVWAALAWGGRLLIRLGHGRSGDGSEMLLLAVAATVAVYCLVGGADTSSHRYLIFLYAVWPLVPAWAFCRLEKLGGMARGVAWIGLSLLAASNLLGSVTTSIAWDAKRSTDYDRSLAVDQALIQDLEKRNLRYVYTTEYWRAKRLTYDAAEKVIFVNAIRDRYPPYYYQALRSLPVSWLASNPTQALYTQSTLEAMGGEFRSFTSAGSYQLLTDISPPAGTPRLLPPGGLDGTAGANPGRLKGAWDLTAAGRWHGETEFSPGQEVSLDLGREVHGVCQVLLLSSAPGRQPPALEILGSADGVNWRKLGGWTQAVYPGLWSGPQPVIMRFTPWQEVRFAPADLRYLRLVNQGERKGWDWDLVELLVGVAESDGTPAPDARRAAEFIAAQPEKGAVWCEPVLTAWLKPELRLEVTTSFRPPWLASHLHPLMLIPTNQDLRLAVREGVLESTRKVLTECGWEPQVKRDHGYALIEAPALASAKRAPDRVVLAKPAPQGGWLVELDKPSRIEAINVYPPEGGLWESLKLKASGDGKQWWPLQFRTRRPPQLYWAGFMPLAARNDYLSLELNRDPAGWLWVIPPAGMRATTPLKVEVFTAGG